MLPREFAVHRQVLMPKLRKQACSIYSTLPRTDGGDIIRCKPCRYNPAKRDHHYTHVRSY
jgi:hypothetical protein